MFHHELPDTSPTPAGNRADGRLWIASWLGPLVTDRDVAMVPGRTLEE